MKRKLIINADDIGMHAAVDHAAMALVETGVVTSVSVMALGHPMGDAIRMFRGYGADIGLHLDLTSAMANIRHDTNETISSLILKAYRGQLNLQQTQDIVRSQIQQFSDKVGMLPAFIDGHEHVHQLPIVRDALMKVLGEMPHDFRPYVRCTRPQHWRGSKAALIGLLGAKSLRDSAASIGCLYNTDFLGVYDFSDKRIAQLWHRWLQTVPDVGALLMCHPGLQGQNGDNDFRQREYRLLASVEFEDMLSHYGVLPSSWQETVGSNLVTRHAAFAT